MSWTAADPPHSQNRATPLTTDFDFDYYIPSHWTHDPSPECPRNYWSWALLPRIALLVNRSRAQGPSDSAPEDNVDGLSGHARVNIAKNLLPAFGLPSSTPQFGLVASSVRAEISVHISMCGSKFSLYTWPLNYLPKHLYSCRVLHLRRIALPSGSTVIWHFCWYCQIKCRLWCGTCWAQALCNIWRQLSYRSNRNEDTINVISYSVVSQVIVHSARRDEKPRCVKRTCSSSRWSLIYLYTFSESCLSEAYTMPSKQTLDWKGRALWYNWTWEVRQGDPAQSVSKTSQPIEHISLNHRSRISAGVHLL